MEQTDEEVGVISDQQPLERGPVANFMNSASDTPPMEALTPLPIPAEQSQAHTALSGLTRGLMTNAVDPLTIGMDAMINPEFKGQEYAPGDYFILMMDRAKRIREAESAAFPKTQTGTEIAGAMGTGIGIGAIPKVKAAMAANPFKASSVVGAGMGAMYGAGSSENLADVPANFVTYCPAIGKD